MEYAEKTAKVRAGKAIPSGAACKHLVPSFVWAQLRELLSQSGKAHVYKQVADNTHTTSLYHKNSHAFIYTLKPNSSLQTNDGRVGAFPSWVDVMMFSQSQATLLNHRSPAVFTKHSG